MGQDGLVCRDGVWHTNTTVLGRRLRVSLHTTDRKVARTKARQLVVDLETHGAVALQRDRATVADALVLAERDARVNGRKSVWKTATNVKRLTAAFGDLKLAALTGAHIMAYIDARKAEGFANASINRELATFRRSLILALDAELVARVPRIRLLKEAAPRSGFIEQHSTPSSSRTFPSTSARCSRRPSTRAGGSGQSYFRSNGIRSTSEPGRSASRRARRNPATAASS